MLGPSPARSSSAPNAPDPSAATTPAGPAAAAPSGGTGDVGGPLEEGDRVPGVVRALASAAAVTGRQRAVGQVRAGRAASGCRQRPCGHGSRRRRQRCVGGVGARGPGRTAPPRRRAAGRGRGRRWPGRARRPRCRRSRRPPWPSRRCGRSRRPRPRRRRGRRLPGDERSRGAGVERDGEVDPALGRRCARLEVALGRRAGDDDDEVGELEALGVDLDEVRGRERVQPGGRGRRRPRRRPACAGVVSSAASSTSRGATAPLSLSVDAGAGRRVLTAVSRAAAVASSRRDPGLGRPRSSTTTAAPGRAEGRGGRLGDGGVGAGEHDERDASVLEHAGQHHRGWSRRCRSRRASVAAFASSSWPLSAPCPARSPATSLLRVSPISPLRGPAPRTIPTARARKIETMETRWYRKSINRTLLGWTTTGRRCGRRAPGGGRAPRRWTTARRRGRAARP